eukprot:9394606-Lingulodinium_polyedra.AAC.1
MASCDKTSLRGAAKDRCPPLARRWRVRTRSQHTSRAKEGLRSAAAAPEEVDAATGERPLPRPPRAR